MRKEESAERKRYRIEARRRYWSTQNTFICENIRLTEELFESLREKSKLLDEKKRLLDEKLKMVDDLAKALVEKEQMLDERELLRRQLMEKERRQRLGEKNPLEVSQ